MNIKIVRKPVFHIIFRGFFNKESNKEIILEAKRNRKKFQDSIIGKKEKIKKQFRNNLVCYYDEIYNVREQSVLIRETEKKFQEDKFREVLSSSPYPICDFGLTNVHETQVSRYGNNQKYKWHIDRFDNRLRIISLVYYFFKEPKKWKGGELGLTDSPIYTGIEVEKNRDIKIKPENNMAVMFGGNVPHCVYPIVEQKRINFGDGRFSANIWVGIK